MWLGELDRESFECLVAAQREARCRGHSEIGPEHLLLGLLEDDLGVVGGALRASAIDPADIRAAMCGTPIAEPKYAVKNDLWPTPETDAILGVRWSRPPPESTSSHGPGTHVNSYPHPGVACGPSSVRWHELSWRRLRGR